MFSEVFHRRVFLFGLVGLTSGLLFGPVFISLSQALLGLNWFLELNYKPKINSLIKNKFFWILASLILLHVFGLIYTTDFPFAINDIKTKIPLLVITILFLSTKPLTVSELRLVLRLFVLSVVASSIYCFCVYLGLTHKVILNIRDASVFISHIRFSLIIAFAVFVIAYFIKQKKHVFVGVICFLWLLFFMYKLQMATGLVLLSITAFCLGIFYVLKYTRLFVKISSLVFVGCLLVFSVYKTTQEFEMYEPNVNSVSNTLYYETINKNSYLQDTLFKLAENGTLITINISDFELQKEWDKRSELNYDGKDKKGNRLRFTILRYLASKALLKDSVGLNQLTKQDVCNIENGIPNFKYSLNNGLILKWRELVWELIKYKRHENPSGHTLTMRFEFWKTALYIIKENPLFGVGTGDVQLAFDKAYLDTDSKLSKNWQLRCHNQYLAITVAFGFIGLLVFLFYFLFPIVQLKNNFHPLYWPFLLIILLSFMTEDTLENQTGLTFFAVFQTLFVWLASTKLKTKE